MAHTSNQRGFSAVETLLIFVIVGILGFTGWFVWHAQKAADKTLSQTGHSSTPSVTKKIANFTDCTKAAGSMMQETYPEICVTKAGQKFTGPSTGTSPSPGTSTSQSSLAISEWHVQLPLSAHTTDASYAITDTDVAHLTTARLQSLVAQVHGCHPGMDDIYVRRSTTAPATGVASAHVGAYYYTRYKAIEPACLSQFDDTVDTQSITQIQNELLSAIPNISAE